MSAKPIKQLERRLVKITLKPCLLMASNYKEPVFTLMSDTEFKAAKKERPDLAFEYSDDINVIFDETVNVEEEAELKVVSTGAMHGMTLPVLKESE